MLNLVGMCRDYQEYTALNLRVVSLKKAMNEEIKERAVRYQAEGWTRLAVPIACEAGDWPFKENDGYDIYLLAPGIMLPDGYDGKRFIDGDREIEDWLESLGDQVIKVTW